MKYLKGNKGFTLIELLVVIAIIAVLSVVVILTLNPAELLRQARDSNRISDLNTIKSAVGLFEADTSSSSIGTYLTCYEGAIAANGTTSAACGTWFAKTPTPTASSTPATVGAGRAVDGTGWVPVNFKAISSGSPIGLLPYDPLNNNNLNLYSYRASSTALTFKLAVRLESAKYGNGGGSDAVSTDGGNDILSYETGTDISL